MTLTQTGTAAFITTDDPRWASALERTPHDFFHLPGYLEAIAPHEEGEPTAFLYEDGDHGLLVPLVRRSLASFGEGFAGHCDLSSPYGYPGPLAWGDGWEARLPETLATFAEQLRQCQAVSLFLRLNPFAGPAPEHLEAFGTVRLEGPTIYLDLKDRAGSWSGINPSNRGFINRMHHRGFRVLYDQWETVEAVVEAYHQTMARLGAKPYYFFPLPFFQHLMQRTSPHLHLATCYSPDGDICGGVFFTEVTGLVQYYLTGVFEDFMEASPAKLLINAIRLWGLERGHHTLNLGGGVGSRRDSLFEFKVRFSKAITTFATLRKVIDPEVYEALAHARGGQEDDYFPAYRRP